MNPKYHHYLKEWGRIIRLYGLGRHLRESLLLLILVVITLRFLVLGANAESMLVLSLYIS
jgi:hypothetical protein